MSNASDFIIQNGVLKKYVGPGGDVVIPMGVTVIGGEAFCGCSNLTSITIPDSVTRVEWLAFKDCCNLATVIMPDSVSRIGEGAFDGCVSLRREDGFTIIGDRLFSWSGSATDVVVPDGVRTIESGAFIICSGVIRVTIPEGVTSIGASAFQGCTGLTEISIPNSVIEIGNSAFYNCSALRKITLPDGITTLGGYAFARCSNLEEVHLPEGLTEIGEHAFYQCSKLENVVIPGSVSQIGKWAFVDCISLQSVIIPAGLTEIEECTFKGCSAMITVTIPESVTKIGKESFYGCRSLISVIIPNGVLTVGSSAFAHCVGLTSLTISESVTKISDYAFSGCKALTSVIILGKTAKIAASAFANIDSACFHVEAINMIPAALRNQAACMFVGNADTFDEAEKQMYYKHIKSSVGKLVELAAVNPALLQILCDEKAITAKLASDYLEAVQKGGKPECIAMMLDYNANSLTAKSKKTAASNKEKAEENVTDRKIKRQDKEGIDGLRFVVTGDLETFSKRADLKVFLESKGAKMASSMSSKVDYLIMNNAKTDTDKRKAAEELGIEIISERQLNDMVGRLFEIDEYQILTKFYGYSGKVEIPDGVKEIGRDAFRGCRGVFSVIIPQSVTRICNYAFAGCGFTSMKIPDAVTKIDYSAFASCIDLTEVILSENITDIDEGVFRSCLALKHIMLPAKLRKISKEMFSGCTSLEEIVIPEACYAVGIFAFSGCTNLKAVHMGANTHVEYGAFDYCPNLTIYAPAGSYAETYANEHKIPFVAE